MLRESGTSRTRADPDAERLAAPYQPACGVDRDRRRGRSQRDPPMIVVPAPGALSTRQGAADRAEPVAHVHEAVARRPRPRRRSRRRRRRPRSRACSSSPRDRDGDRRALARVLAGVLHRLEAAEVDRGLGLGRVAVDALGRRPRSAARRGSPRCAAPRRARGPAAAAGRCRGRARGARPASSARRRAAPRASSRRSAGSASTSWRASPTFTASATRCCCAPSCRLRSIRRRDSSAAVDDAAPRGLQLARCAPAASRGSPAARSRAARCAGRARPGGRAR